MSPNLKWAKIWISIEIRYKKRINAFIRNFLLFQEFSWILIWLPKYLKNIWGRKRKLGEGWVRSWKILLIGGNKWKGKCRKMNLIVFFNLKIGSFFRIGKLTKKLLKWLVIIIPFKSFKRRSRLYKSSWGSFKKKVNKISLIL